MLRERLYQRSLPDHLYAGEVKEYKPDDILFLEDTEVKESVCYGVVEGLVGIGTVYPDGERNFITFVARPGDVVGIEDILGGYHDSTARVLTRRSVIVKKQIRPEEMTASWVLQSVSKRVKAAEEKQVFFSHANVLSRLSYALAELSVSSIDENGKESLLVPLSHPRIGEVVGCSREAVGIKMKRLAEKGLASQKDEGLIEIHDLPGLVTKTNLYKLKLKQRRRLS